MPLSGEISCCLPLGQRKHAPSPWIIPHLAHQYADRPHHRAPRWELLLAARRNTGPAAPIPAIRGLPHVRIGQGHPCNQMRRTFQKITNPLQHAGDVWRNAVGELRQPERVVGHALKRPKLHLGADLLLRDRAQGAEPRLSQIRDADRRSNRRCREWTCWSGRTGLKHRQAHSCFGKVVCYTHLC